MRRLESVYFVGTGPVGAQYARLARVLEHTARRHCPDWQIAVRGIHPVSKRESRLGIHSHVSNTHKLESWHETMQSAQDGDEVLLIDADTMILQPLDAVWSHDFDVAYTVKGDGRTRLPFNGGVLFVRVSDRTKRFMAAYWAKNLEFLGDATKHRLYRETYGGMNQAAFGALLPPRHHHQDYGRVTLPAFDVTLLELPCREWNAEQSAWAHVDSATRIVHVKSGLRRAIFHGQPPAQLQALVKMWTRFDAEVTAKGN